MHARRMVAALAVVAMLAGACGGNDEGSRVTEASTSDADASSSGYPDAIVAAADSIQAEWTGADAIGVTLLAADAGYTVDQIVEHPNIEADGTIDGVEPSGEPRDVVGDTREGAGEASLGASRVLLIGTSSTSPADSYLMGIDRTAEQLWQVAQEHVASQQAEQRAAVDAGRFTLILTLLLMDRGYSLDQVVESLFFGTFRVGNVPCVEIDDDPPAVPPGPDGMRGCAPLPGTDTTEATDGTDSAADGTDDGSDDSDRGTGARFVGAISGDDSSEATVLVNRIELMAGDDLTGTIEYMVEYRLTESSAQIDCFSVIVALPPGAVTSTGDGTYAGSASGQAHTPAGGCPADGAPQGPAAEVAEGPLTATISGNTLTGTWGKGAQALSFTATRQS